MFDTAQRLPFIGLVHRLIAAVCGCGGADRLDSFLGDFPNKCGSGHFHPPLWHVEFLRRGCAERSPFSPDSKTIGRSDIGIYRWRSSLDLPFRPFVVPETRRTLGVNLTLLAQQ